jgi:iron complex outermembrane receptor protein
MHHCVSPTPRRVFAAVLLALALFAGPAFSHPAQQEKGQEKEKEKTVKITEEIQVVGKAPKAQPVSTVTTLDFARIDQNRPLDLAEAIRYAPGVNVTVGNKSEFTLKLRGMDSSRIVLLIDGVPSYEPYFGTFDLKTVAAAGIDSLQITKGPSSVLYGPNTLGGVVNVITRRPGADPYLMVNGSFGENNTWTGGLDGGFRLGRFSLAGNVGFQDSDGYSYPDPNTGTAMEFANTQYRRFNMNAKLFYAPSDSTELMVNGNIYTSNYGMPAALAVQSARYWKFKDWDRYGLNAGGFTSLGENATLRFRAFAVNYDNTLDQFKDKAMTVRQYESTYNNSVYGAFALDEFRLASWNSLRTSVDYQQDVARIQSDVGMPFVNNHQGTFSVAAEDEVKLAEQWRVIGGLSLDVINKFIGPSTSRLNPLLGLKFSPLEELDIHASVSQKSRMPNMRALYSTSGGNPDLLSETGTNAEIGLTWNKGVYVSAAAFTYKFKNMIDTYVRPDGVREYMNVGRAHINGFEIQVQKSFGWIDGTINYTYLDHRNDVANRPLDALSPDTLNFDLTVRPIGSLRLSLYGLHGSRSHWWDSKSNRVLTIPDYFSLDAVAAYDLGGIEVFVKATNLMNDYFYVEPVFPWRGRFIEFGAKINVF